MKKYFCLILCLILLLTLAGCGNNSASGKTGNQAAGVNDVLEERMTEEEAETKIKEETEQESEQETETGKTDNAENIDVDLTVLSSTMIYSEVLNMMTTPEDYIGKTVKMDGYFAFYHDEDTDKYYYACIIPDATACCSQGIEFVLAGDHVFPDDYPEEQDEICVVGEFDTYQEGEYTYCTLRNASFVS